jgi:MFS transporter, TsgA protein
MSRIAVVGSSMMDLGGTEHIPDAPPQLVTFLLLSASVGGTVAPAVSARFVDLYGPGAGVVMAACRYALALACALVALVVERTSRRPRPLPQVVT